MEFGLPTYELKRIESERSLKLKSFVIDSTVIEIKNFSQVFDSLRPFMELVVTSNMVYRRASLGEFSKSYTFSSKSQTSENNVQLRENFLSL